MKQPTRDQLVSLHESGHALVALGLGCRVHEVDMLRGPSRGGRCLTTLPNHGPGRAALLFAGAISEQIAIEGGAPPQPETASWRLTNGRIAADLSFPETERVRAQIGTGPADVTSSDADHLRSVSSANQVQGFEVATDFLLNHWPAVVAVAERLLAIGKLDGDSVAATARRHGVLPPWLRTPSAKRVHRARQYERSTGQATSQVALGLTLIDARAPLTSEQQQCIRELAARYARSIAFLTSDRWAL